jgi:nucleotide-binding universal stress UspA family protein
MNKLFNNILVPIDFSDVSELAIEKAIDIGNHFRCNVHLVFVQAQGLLIKQPGQLTRSLQGRPADAEAKLYQLQNKFTYQLHPGLSMHACIRRGNRTRTVVEYALRHHIDLVIIGRTTNLFPGNYNIREITRRIECPVLSVRRDSPQQGLSNIVLPVCSMLPIRKIMFASYLARKYNSKIHLLAVAGEGEDERADRNQYLHKAYQLLKDNTNLNIECHTMRGHNIAETTLRFAEKIDADLIVVNPGNESKLSGFINKVFDGSLFNESKIPVMTISPYNA